jgi:hypothetical protein
MLGATPTRRSAVSDAALKKIEKAISRIADEQVQIRAQLASLEACVAQISTGASGTPDATREDVITFLDQFRAGEALGEASLGAWIEVCHTDCLRGGLRTVQLREASHARLLEERIKELGGSPSFELPESVHGQAMEDAASSERSDALKLKEFVSRFSDIDATLAPIYGLSDRLDADEETQSLLRTIAQDERSTLEFLHEACALLNPS